MWLLALGWMEREETAGRLGAEVGKKHAMTAPQARVPVTFLYVHVDSTEMILLTNYTVSLQHNQDTIAICGCSNDETRFISIMTRSLRIELYSIL